MVGKGAASGNWHAEQATLQLQLQSMLIHTLREAHAKQQGGTTFTL